MILVQDRNEIYKHFEDLKSLNIKGILNNTDYEAYVDDLDHPSGIWIKDNYFQFLYAKTTAFVDLFDSSIDQEDFGFSGANDVVLDYYLNKDHSLILWRNTCNQYHYEGQGFDCDLGDSLKQSDAGFVNDNYEYKNDYSLDKIKTAISNRPTAGKYVNGLLVSYVMLHDDDSIGYMYTLPEYRGHGYAFELTKDIINKTLKSGRLPYVQIVKSNVKSIGLAEKSGFKYHGEVHWFGIIRQGDWLKGKLVKYKEIYGDRALSVSVNLTLKLKEEALEVTLEGNKVCYKDQVYQLDYTYEDEIYYVQADMPEDIYISALMALMDHDYEICITNKKMTSKAFQDAFND